MGRKVFVSYKFKDEMVAKLQSYYIDEIDGELKINYRNTRARDYVNLLQRKIGFENINLGEKDGESLAQFSDYQIETSLKSRIRQCSITVVLLSKGMKTNAIEKNQWIPWEISYSLRRVPTGGNTKQRNAVLGIVLPDETGTYSWYYTSNRNCNCVTHHTGLLFKILRDNMFNICQKQLRKCDGLTIYGNNEPSFIKTVRWDEFMNGDDYNFYFDRAIAIRDNEEFYDIHVNLD